MDRKATDDIFGPVIARNEDALLSDDPSFQGAISSEPLTQLEVVAQARQTSDADGHEPETGAADTAPEPMTIEPMTQRRVLTLATPIIGENLLQTLVGAVDTFMVARLGAAAVAGVGIGFELVFFIISILSAIDIGATVLVSQAIGAGQQERANRLARQAIVWGLLLAVPVSIVMFVAAPTVIGLFGAEPDVTAAATTYLQVTAATSVALFLSFVCGAVLRGAGDSRTPLQAAVLANIVNVIVAYVLIFGHFGLPALGVAGSALGAAAGRSLGAAYMLVVMARGRKAISLGGTWGWRPRLATARQLFTLGVPAAMEQVLSSGAFMVLVGVVALIGTHALAAQQITFTALSLAFLPAFGFSIAATALVGQSIGARVPADATESVPHRAALGAGLDGDRGCAHLPLQRAGDERLLGRSGRDRGRHRRAAVVERRAPLLGALVRQQRQFARQRRYADTLVHRRLDDVALGADRLDRGALVRGWAGNGLVRVRADHGAGVGADVVGLSPAHRRLRAGTARVS